MWYYHITPWKNLGSIGKHGLLSGKRLRELNAGEQTTGWKSGEPFIHVTDSIAKSVAWFREVFFAAEVPASDGWWAIIRFESSSVAIQPLQDPMSTTGLIFALDCIPPEVLTYRFAEDYQEGQGDEVGGVSVWRPLTRD